MSIRSFAKYAGYAIAGGMVGATVALLTAPAPGDATRRRIADWFRDERDSALRKGYGAMEHVSGYVHDRVAERSRKFAS